MTHPPYFFGYGSLVNTATHDFPDPRPARLAGWRRVWMHTDMREAAFLTVIPDPDSTIDGLVAQVPGADWQALDRREWAYERVPVADQLSHTLSDVSDISVYAVPTARQTAQGGTHPVFLSYLDVVVQGYLQHFGQDGAKAFFASTSGWDVPIVDDRAMPRYPRHQRLSPAETGFVDAMLETVRVVP